METTTAHRSLHLEGETGITIKHVRTIQSKVGTGEVGKSQMTTTPHLSLCQLQLGTLHLHLELHEQIMSRPPAPQLLPVHVDRNGQQRQEDRSPTKDVQDLRRAIGFNPGVGKVRQAVEHEVLQND